TQESLREAEELKKAANDHFKASQWNEALVSYRTALGHLPKRKESPKQEISPAEALDSDDDADLGGPRDTAKLETETPPSEIEIECSKARSILNANIAACLMNVGEQKDVVEACTQALLDDPSYIKALQRRAAANEKINTWTSLTHAQEDYTALVDLLPPSSPQHVQAKKALTLLKPRQEAAQKKETDEMMTKLKGLGNTFLSNFGLSTDNFKFEPNGQGGYSMNVSR
ncbi:TPR-like protein, partial [Hygrophoropsis aurantiaca]